jgi:biotin carboxyl carrier protein
MLQVGVNGKKTVEVSNEDAGYVLNGQAVDFDLQLQPNGLISVLKDGKSYTAILENLDRKSKEVTVSVDGQTYKMTLREPIDQLLSNMGMDLKARSKADSVKAPMPGMVLKVLVAPGQEVKKGDGLVILEAMKMENVLKAAEDGTVKAIKVGERTAVEKGAVLIEMGR